MDIMALKWNNPLDTIPIGQTAQNTGNLKIAEPTSDETKIPFAKYPFILYNGHREHPRRLPRFLFFLSVSILC